MTAHSSLEACEVPIQNMDSRRLTVWPFSFLIMSLSRAVSFTPRDLLKGPVPVLLFPLVAVRSAVQGLFQTMIACVHRIEGRALGAERAFSDGKIRVALGGDELAVFHIGDDLTLY